MPRYLGKSKNAGSANSIPAKIRSLGSSKNAESANSIPANVRRFGYWQICLKLQTFVLTSPGETYGVEPSPGPPRSRLTVAL